MQDPVWLSCAGISAVPCDRCQTFLNGRIGVPVTPLQQPVDAASPFQLPLPERFRWSGCPSVGVEKVVTFGSPVHILSSVDAGSCQCVGVSSLYAKQGGLVDQLGTQLQGTSLSSDDLSFLLDRCGFDIVIVGNQYLRVITLQERLLAGGCHTRRPFPLSESSSSDKNGRFLIFFLGLTRQTSV